MSENHSDVTRRRFLVMATGAASVTACSSSTGVAPASVGTVSSINVSSLTVPSLEAIGTMPVCIGRDTNGVYAMTLTCTHAGCLITSVSASGLECPCHQSTYDANGNVTGGPAPAPLQHFAVTVDASGNLTIHGDQDVSATTRLAV